MIAKSLRHFFYARNRVRNFYLRPIMAIHSNIETLPINEQQLFQTEKLKELLQYINKNSPWYQNRFKETGTDLAQINTYTDLQQLPVTTKQDIQANNWAFLCVPKSEIKEYTATSGTLGAPVVIALTENDLQRLAYNEYLSFGCMDAGQEDTFQLMLTLDRQFMAGMAYYGGLRKLGAASVRTGPGLPAMQWEVIQQLQSSHLIAVPSFLLKMIDYAKANNIDLRNTPVKKVLAIGESLHDSLLHNNALATKILEGWDIQLYNTYASTEMQTAFTECSYGQGGHHQPELLIVELLDDNGLPVPEDEKGEVTITTLGVEGMPLLRYRTGDICKAYYEPCACGRKTMRLGPVLGRKQQMIKFKGTSIYPPALFDLLNEVKEVAEYYVAVDNGEDGQDRLTLYIHTAATPDLCDAVVKPIFKHKLRVVPQINYITADQMQKLQFPARSRKQVRFNDLRS